MKVWVLVESDYDYSANLAVFGSHGDAQKALAHHKRQPSGYDYDLEEHDLLTNLDYLHGEALRVEMERVARERRKAAEAEHLERVTRAPGEDAHA